MCISAINRRTNIWRPTHCRGFSAAGCCSKIARQTFLEGCHTMTQPLSERQRQILHFISQRQQEGWTPSMREIGEAVGLRSSAAVQKQLTSLERNGYIRRLTGQARSIQIVHPVPAS